MSNPEPPGNLNSSRATAQILGQGSVRTLKRWIAAGKFPKPDVIQNGRGYWFDRTIRKHVRGLVSEKAVATTETSPTT